MTPAARFTYRDVVDIDSPELERLVRSGRHLLETNDNLMSSAVGPEYSIYVNSVEAALRVAMVNLGYGMQRKDWTMAAIAMAAQEVCLTQTNRGLDDAQPEELQSACDTLCGTLRDMAQRLPEAKRKDVFGALKALVRNS